jgi:hypothetical protein
MEPVHEAEWGQGPLQGRRKCRNLSTARDSRNHPWIRGPGQLGTEDGGVMWPRVSSQARQLKWTCVMQGVVQSKRAELTAQEV